MDVTKLPVPVLDKETHQMQHSWMVTITNVQNRRFETKLFPRNPTSLEISGWLVEIHETLTLPVQLLTDNGDVMNSDAMRDVLSKHGIELKKPGSESARKSNAAEGTAKKIQDALSAAPKPITDAAFKKLIDQLRQSPDRN
jgi:hypothetical protein